MSRLWAVAAIASGLALAACGNGAEQAGENMDSSIEEATQGQENLGDGPLERAGEAVDEATGTERTNDAANSLNDATDGSNITTP